MSTFAVCACYSGVLKGLLLSVSVQYLRLQTMLLVMARSSAERIQCMLVVQHELEVYVVDHPILSELLQVGSLNWEAAGKQLMEEEEQAAAKAAAKKAKKLRQKLNKQPTPGTNQGQTAAQDSSVQHSPDPEAPDADNDASQLLNINVLLTQPSQDAAAAPAPLDSQSTGSSSGQMSHLQPRQADDSMVTAAQSLGSTTAVSIADTALPPSSSPGNVAEYTANKQQPSANGSDSSAADDDMFLQDLFTCPLTKVSGYCNKMIVFCTFL